MNAEDRAVALFRRQWGAEPELLVRAPGRVNLIGEHTDYNDGFVLPMAIDRATWLALASSGDDDVAVVSETFPDPVAFSVADDDRVAGWGAYIQGMTWALRSDGIAVAGWRGAVASDIPVGAGLSSSASVELAAGLGSLVVAGEQRDPARLAVLAQRAENDWVGMSCGVMDQLAVAAGRAGHALQIDCRSLMTRAVPLPAGVAVLVCDTGTRRGLVDSAYNERRRQCEAAARAMGVASLRDATPALLEATMRDMDAVEVRRARHVITENARVLAAARALADGDAAGAGRLMHASHVSLRDDFEVSGPALEAMVDAALAQDGCFGARLTGAGFAGCVVGLVDARAAERIAQDALAAFRARCDHDAAIYVCHAADGTTTTTAAAV
jgi:galactokinase